MFDSVEKNLLLGAFATAGVDLALEAYYTYMTAIGKSPANQFPFNRLHPALPPNDDIIACAGIPFLLYALGKGWRKPGLVQMSKGGAIYGVSTLIGETAYEVVRTSQPTGLRLVPLR